MSSSPAPKVHGTPSKSNQTPSPNKGSLRRKSPGTKTSSLKKKLQSLTAKRKQLRQDELAVITDEAASWIFSTLKMEYKLGEDEDLFDKLADGKVLCRLINSFNDANLQIKFREDAKVGSFFARDNCLLFLKACRSLGVPEVILFSPDDLMSRANPRKVANCILSLSKIAAVSYQIEAPSIVQYELEIEALQKFGGRKRSVFLVSSARHVSTPTHRGQLQDNNSSTTTANDSDSASGSQPSSTSSSDSSQPTSQSQLSVTVPPDSTGTILPAHCRLDFALAQSASEQEYQPYPRFRDPDTGAKDPIDEAVGAVLDEYQIEWRGFLFRVESGKYQIGLGPAVYVRLVRNVLLVRAGGEWHNFMHFARKRYYEYFEQGGVASEVPSLDSPSSSSSSETTLSLTSPSHRRTTSSGLTSPHGSTPKSSTPKNVRVSLVPASPNSSSFNSPSATRTVRFPSPNPDEKQGEEKNEEKSGEEKSEEKGGEGAGEEEEEEVKDEVPWWKTALEEGNLHFEASQYAEALQVYESGIATGREKRDELALMLLYSAFAKFWQSVGEFVHAYEYFVKSRELARVILSKNRNHPLALAEEAVIFHSIEAVKEFLKNADKAITHLLELKEHHEAAGSTYAVAMVQQALGNAYIQKAEVFHEGIAMCSPLKGVDLDDEDEEDVEGADEEVVEVEAEHDDDVCDPPQWEEGSACKLCRKEFPSFLLMAFMRKHHCRNCGGLVCGDCSRKTHPIPRYGFDQPVRVCDVCYQALSQPGKGSRRGSVPTSDTRTKADVAANSASKYGIYVEVDIDVELANTSYSWTTD